MKLTQAQAQALASRAGAEKTRIAPAAANGLRMCGKCKIVSGVDDFFKHTGRQDNLHSWCKACCKEGNKRSREKRYSSFEGRIPTFLISCRNSSKKRGHDFSLTYQDLLDCWVQQCGVCVYTGIPMTTQPNLYNSVSVERLDSSIGYVPDNTVLVCAAVNKMKSDLSPDLFVKLCKSTAAWLVTDNGEDVEMRKYG